MEEVPDVGNELNVLTISLFVIYVSVNQISVITFTYAN